MPGALGHGQEPFPSPTTLGRARHQEVGPRPPAHQGSRTGGQTLRQGSVVERKRQQLRLQRLMRAHGAPGGGAASGGRWTRGGRSSSRPAPSLHRAAARLTSALLQHRRVSAGRGPWAPPPHAARWSCPLTVQGVELVRSLAETWGPGQGSGAARGRGRAASRGDTGREGHSPYLGKNRVWSSVRLAPWTRCSNALRKESPTGSERTVCGTQGLLGTRGRGLQGALGAAIRPCSPTAPSRSGPTFGPEGRGREEGGEGPPSPPNSPAGRQIQAPGTYRTASLTAAAPAPGTRRRSRGSPCPRRPRPPARGRPGLWGAGGSAPRQRCARPQQPPPHLGAGSAPGVPCLRTAAALPSRFHPWGHGRLGRMPSMLGHPDPGEAAAEVGSGVLAGTHSFRKVLTVMAEP